MVRPSARPISVAISGPDRTSPATPSLTHGTGTATEHAVRTLANIRRGDARKLHAAERQSEHQISIRHLARTHPEVEKVLPGEGGEHIGRSQFWKFGLIFGIVFFAGLLLIVLPWLQLIG